MHLSLSIWNKLVDIDLSKKQAPDAVLDQTENVKMFYILEEVENYFGIVRVFQTHNRKFIFVSCNINIQDGLT